MKTFAIETEAEYREALAEFKSLLNAKQNTPEEQRLKKLADLIEVYEDKYYSIEPPDPISAINYYLESRGKSIDYLQDILGSKQTVINILEKREPLTTEIINQLGKHLEIPVDILSQPYELKYQAS